MTPTVSIALVTRNGAETLPALLDAVRRQRGGFSVQIVAVDSGSTDGSLALLQRSADRVIAVPPERFNHGLTRNLAIEHTCGELIVLIVQDALPIGESWLSELAAPLLADERVGGTFSRQIVRPDASAITRAYFAHAEAARNHSFVQAPLTHHDLAALHPTDRLRRCTFDNVCACIRRSLWREIPFRETPIAEDLEWARDVLLAGYRLEFVATSCVFHSHDRSARYELARTYQLHRRLYELFELRTIPTLPLLARSVTSCVGRHLACQAHDSGQRFSRLTRALGLAVAWPLGQYLGGLSASRAWRPWKTRTSV
jgi:rhamnosyltransferase